MRDAESIEEDITELKKEVDELKRAIGYITSSLDNLMHAMSLNDEVKEYRDKNVFVATLEHLARENQIKVGFTIDNVLREIERFISKKENFLGAFTLYMHSLQNYLLKECTKGKSSKIVKFNYYGSFPRRAFEISFGDGVVTKIESYAVNETERLLKSLAEKHDEKDDEGKVCYFF